MSTTTNPERAQPERDVLYLSAMQIVDSLYQKGLVLDSELVRINAILARKFSASSVAKTPKIACIKQ